MILLRRKETGFSNSCFVTSASSVYNIDNSYVR